VSDSELLLRIYELKISFHSLKDARGKGVRANITDWRQREVLEAEI
jgi:hypothetical protein